MTTLALFDNAGRVTREATPRARNTDPCSSHKAAERTAEFRGKHEAAIFNAICESGPLGVNFKEIAQMTGMEPVAVARRLSAMGERKLIERRVIEGAARPDDFQTRNGCALWWKRI